MPKVRLTVDGLDGPNPEWEQWMRLPAEEQRKTKKPHHSIPKPPGTIVEATDDEAAVLIGRKMGELVSEAPAKSIVPPGSPAE